MPKRKRSQSADAAVPEHSPHTCILHTLAISDHGSFTALSNIKGTAIERLQPLHNICDRRLRQSHDSPYRTQSIISWVISKGSVTVESKGPFLSGFDFYEG